MVFTRIPRPIPVTRGGSRPPSFPSSAAESQPALVVAGNARSFRKNSARDGDCSKPALDRNRDARRRRVEKSGRRRVPHLPDETSRAPYRAIHHAHKESSYPMVGFEAFERAWLFPEDHAT